MNHSKPIFYDGNLTTKKKDAQAFILWKNNTIYVSFRGTKDLNDILDVINIKPKKIFENTQVHSGFAEQFLSIEQDITKDINHLMIEYPIEKIIFTGHSMGGALATIAAVTYSKMFRDLYITCHTFGTPSLGNKNLKHLFEACIDEIIPKLHVNKDFIHSTKGIILKNNGIAEFISEQNIYKSYPELIYNLIRKEEYQKVTKYHSCEMYIERLFTLKHLK